MRLILLLFAIQLSAQAHLPYNPLDIDKGLQRYIDQYIDVMTAAGVEIPNQERFWVKFAGDNIVRPPVVGMAFGMFDPKSVVVGITPRLLALDKQYLKWVLWHELTHDLFDIRHESGLWLMMPSLPEYVTDYDVERALCDVADYLAGN